MKTGWRRWQQVCAALAVLALCGVLVARKPVLVALILPGVVGVAGLIVLAGVINRWDGDDSFHRRLLWWTLLGFGAHLLFSVVMSTMNTPLNYARTDASTYHAIARGIVDYWTTGAPRPEVPGGKEGFYYLLGALYWALGPHRIAGLVVNAALASALVVLLTDATWRLFGKAAARYVPPMMVLLPGLFLWTSQLLKEAPVLFVLAIALNCGVRMTDRVSLGGILGLTLSLALLFTFRGQVAIVLAGSLVIGIVVGSRHLISGMGVATTAVSVLGVLVLALGLGLSGYRAGVNSDLERASVVRADLAVSANSGFDQGVDISTPKRAVFYLPIGLFNFSLGPMPWQIHSTNEAFALPDVIVWWCLLPALWRGFRAAGRRKTRHHYVLVIPAVMAAMLFSLAIGNFGTVVRERAQVVILLVPLIALGLTLRAGSPRRSHSNDGRLALAE